VVHGGGQVEKTDAARLPQRGSGGPAAGPTVMPAGGPRPLQRPNGSGGMNPGVTPAGGVRP